MFSQLCLCVVVFETCFLSHTVPHHTYGTSRKLYVKPLTLHTRQLSCVSDLVGQRLLLQTSNIAMCDSTLGGLPSDVGTLRSEPACANIFLTRVYCKTLCEIYLHPQEE